MSIKHKGSSETVRGINNNVYSKILNKRTSAAQFKFWFIGFAEGDGCFSTYKKKYLEFKITQSSKNAQILFYIKKELGFGSVSIQDKINKTHQFRVRNKEAIVRLINVFNGNIKTNSKNIQLAARQR